MLLRSACGLPLLLISLLSLLACGGGADSFECTCTNTFSFPREEDQVDEFSETFECTDEGIDEATEWADQESIDCQDQALELGASAAECACTCDSREC